MPLAGPSRTVATAPTASDRNGRRRRLIVLVVSAASVGAVVGSRRPDHPVGWLLLALAEVLYLPWLCCVYLSYALILGPGALPGRGSSRSGTRPSQTRSPC